jgi:hypothetical protein
MVEDVVDEVVDRAAVGEDGLPDMDQLRGLLADDVNAEEDARLAV